MFSSTVCSRINIAQWQNIVLNDPQWHGIGINELPPYSGCTETESFDIDVFFSTATYRFGHIGAVDYVARRELSGADESIFLGNAFFNPNVVTQSGGGIDSLLNVRAFCFVGFWAFARSLPFTTCIGWESVGSARRRCTKCVVCEAVRVG